MNYNEFLKQKQIKVKEVGFDVNDEDLNVNLFDFQRFIIKTALKKGRYAIFADCGLGKTLMQLEWARKVADYTKQKVLILLPLAVKGQTINEAQKFDISLEDIEIYNYEQLDNIDCRKYAGIVLDESSILKNFTGVYKNKIIDSFKNTNFKLCCTATPAPNDLNEIGNHSEFLDVMSSGEMRMRWFVRDEEMNNYRLKGHSKSDFYGWISSWASVLRKPSDVGNFENKGYELPKLNFIENKIETDKRDNGLLFNSVSVNATDFNKELRLTIIPRMELTKQIIETKKDENFIIWCNQNAEEDELKKIIPEAIGVRGDEKTEIKEKKLLGFAKNEFRILITKKKIAQFGLNYQNCNNQIFSSLDFSFEGLYQAIRRSYRFGQKKEVNIYIITTDTMSNVLENIKQKQIQFDEMMNEITKQVNKKEFNLKMDYIKKEYKTEDYHIYNGDSCEIIKELPSNSMDLSIFSPPFSNLFTYSDSVRDMGNCKDNNEFFKQNEFLLKELYRIMKNGRLVCVHSKDLAIYKNSSGYSGMYDFTGDYHRAMEKAGFKYHSKITIWLDPVLEMQRTKTQRLLYKQVCTDSSYTGIGMPEYITIFRKWDGNEDEWQPIKSLNKDNFPLDTWQRWASPVWFDIQRTDVLNNFKTAKENLDEKHICPLQLGVIKRLVAMWSSPNETVFTPFLGIGSELFEAIKLNRKGVGIELKESYFEKAKQNLDCVMNEKKQIDMFV